MRWPGNGGGTVRNARQRLSRVGATLGLTLAIGPPTPAAVAQPTLALRVLSSAERPLGVAALRVTAHRTYGVLVQLVADHAGSAALIVHPRPAERWAQITNGKLASGTVDSALALPSLGDLSSALGANFIEWEGRRFLALVLGDATLHRRVGVEVGRDDLRWLVSAVYEAAGQVREAWDRDSTDRLSVFEPLLAVDAMPSGGGTPPPYPVSLLGGPPRDGFAAVGVLVDTTGRVDPQSVDPIAASDPVLLQTVLAYIPRARFTPGRRAGRPTAMRWMFICEWRFGDPALQRPWSEWVVQRTAK